MSIVRLVVALLAVITAVIHFWLLVIIGGFDPAFFLNGIGYLALTAAYLTNVPLGAGRRPLLHVVFIGYTAVTILAWLALGEKNPATTLGMLGYIDKTVEVLLIIALVVSLRQEGKR
jgi:hypothetical protein